MLTAFCVRKGLLLGREIPAPKTEGSISPSGEKVFFYSLPTGAPDSAKYQHSHVVLAEGLKKLGVSFGSDANYWKTSPDSDEYLLSPNPEVTPENCTIAVIDVTWINAGVPLPDIFTASNRKCTTVCVDTTDENQSQERNPELSKIDFYFKTHFNDNCFYPPFVRPWTFGLSQRILREIENPPPFGSREKRILANSRVSHPLRKVAHEKVLPQLAKVLEPWESADPLDNSPPEAYHRMHWAQSGRRHYPDYYKRLKENVACLCFGGRFVRLWPKDQKAPANILTELLDAIDPRTRPILQGDSWRFIESVAAGCVAVQADMKKYGMRMPVMPENRKHYLGIDLDNIEDTISFIKNNPGALEEISRCGREWALTNYSPKAVAKRFLAEIRSAG